ncbi:7756_t:CDS:1 [Dentiscutata heterogama]|uniref:7756_t:CDS:1 n=1 Tax=Dentiscutata heterogama TaxID=1316150 RepID=A0ACA9MI49_9GLOM|nr:7756_t:CDS:1 [Dentiscutata heterogama]
MLIIKKNQHLKEAHGSESGWPKKDETMTKVRLAKLESGRPKKTKLGIKTIAEEICPAKHGPGRPKKTKTLTKKQKTK